MAVTIEVAAINFIVSLVISTIVIYIVVKLFGEKEGVGTAILAAFVGSVIYALSYFFLGTGLLESVIGGLFWLAALMGLYKIGLAKSFLVALVVWIFATAAGFLLPTLVGPL